MYLFFLPFATDPKIGPSPALGNKAKKAHRTILKGAFVKSIPL
jgi:hypothetical protein